MSPSPRGIAILGSTGSIGRQTLEIVRTFSSQFRVVGLTAGNNWELLAHQCREFQPQVVSCQDPTEQLGALLPRSCRQTEAEEVARHPDVEIVMVATVGAAGLSPLLAALRAGKTVALANKEAVVMCGDLIMAEAHRHGATVLPVDSEPSAIWQCLQGEERMVSRLILTASGGALRDRPVEKLATVTPEEALHHPTWQMGKKITVDSATLMNKAFEVIEAHWLFGVPWERIQVVVHPQSIIHSMVEFADGSVKAHLSPPDMRLPIQYALFYPRRMANPHLARFDPVATGALTFLPLEPGRYPCFDIALEAARRGGTYPAVLSAADEAAVELFLAKHVGFLDIPALVRDALQQHRPVPNPTLEQVLEAAAWAHNHVTSRVS